MFQNVHFSGFTSPLFQVIKDKVQKRKEQNQDSPAKKRLAFIDILIENYERGEIDLDGLREEVDTFMFEVSPTQIAHSCLFK